MAPPIAVTMGDPAGIGPDVILLAWLAREEKNLPTFLVLGDSDCLAQRAKALGLSVPMKVVDLPEQAAKCFDNALPVFDLRFPTQIQPGKPEQSSARIIIDAIDLAVRWCLEGAAAGVVTGPINKNLLALAGFPHPGHTEYLAELCATDITRPRPVMLLAGNELRVVPVTVHLPLKDVPDALTMPLIVETIEITAAAMRHHFRIENPRIGVTGLNPHSGENGTLGTEEIEFITPAIEQLRDRGFDVTGPLPADAAFQERNRPLYDVFIAMYHDQAFIPVKTLAFDSTVNVTLGLPIIRTSPDHGTAYELAGTGRANPGSMIESLLLSGVLARSERVST